MDSLGPPYTRKPPFTKLEKNHKKNRCACSFIWILISLGLLAISTYYLYLIIKPIGEDPIEFKLKPLPKDQMLYPPLKFCYGHWIHWVNFTRVQEMNFTKDELILAASYLGRVYSSEIINVESVEKDFVSKLQAQNLTMAKFFMQIAKDFEPFKSPYNPPRVQKRYSYTLKLAQISEDASNVMAPYYVMCYMYTESHVKSMVYDSMLTNRGKSFIRLDVDQLIPEKTADFDWLTDHEYVAYTRDFNERFFASESYKERRAPFMIYTDAYSNNGILITRKSTMTIEVKPDVKVNVCQKSRDSVHIDFKLSNLKYAFSKSRDCAESCVKNRQWVSSNHTCSLEILENQRTKEFKANFDNQWNDIYSIYKGPIYFLGVKGSVERNLTYEGHFLPLSQNDTENSYKDVEVTMGDDNSANEICKSEIGCEIWSYEIKAMTTMLEDVPRVRIEYPNEDDIVMRVEKNLLTTENVLETLGIYLAVWVLICISFIFQLFHMCFLCCK